ncbi:uncharacterized protein LOC115950070 [Quercus lobata]|uniref:uncharacterized protein LOC115950070 n=1 Tax=Quercus lobata TaxID=97700 RepID=UPI0012465D53|nr:uncharacterized protein LOC115950070 [Quercus lobata]
MTNNKAEYKALITGLDLAKATRAAIMVMYCDSQVVTSQVNGDYNRKNEQMKRYIEQVKNRVSDLQAKFVQIPREENENANRLAKVASAEHMLIPNKLLYYTTARGERRHTNVKVVGWRAALLQRGEQVIDKERDIKEARSDARVLSNGPAQAHPIRGVL